MKHPVTLRSITDPANYFARPERATATAVQPFRACSPAWVVVAVACSALLAAPLRAATYYWDNNDSTNGFGTAAGTWADPTTNDATHGRTTRCP